MIKLVNSYIWNQGTNNEYIYCDSSAYKRKKFSYWYILLFEKTLRFVKFIIMYLTSEFSQKFILKANLKMFNLYFKKTMQTH